MLGITRVSFHSTKEWIPYCDTWDNNTKEFQLNFKLLSPTAAVCLEEATSLFTLFPSTKQELFLSVKEWATNHHNNHSANIYQTSIMYLIIS